MMRKNGIHILLLLLGVNTNAYSQYNPLTNSYDSGNDIDVYSPAKNEHKKNVARELNVQCNSNTFFGIRGTGEIDELLLNGNTVTTLSTIVNTGSAMRSLAICNNLNSGSTTPTFYSSSQNDIAYYDTSGWTVPFSTTISLSLANAGGYGNYLYYHTYTVGFLRNIARYDGTFLTSFYSSGNKIMAVADVAVDNMGNVWFITTPDSIFFNSDSINVVSPSGVLIRQFAFTLDCGNAYGMFLLDNVLYIGLGSANAVHPNTLIPVTFSGNSAIAGTPVNMSTTHYSDLASCSPGFPLSVHEVTFEETERLYPNPAREVITITSKENEKNEYTIYDPKGLIVIPTMISCKHFTTINIQSLSPGIYFIQCKNSKGVFNLKFLKL